MSRDEHGMPLPDNRLLPVKIGDCGQVADRDGEKIEFWVDPEFFIHAANWIIPCREIVGRLDEWNSTNSNLEDLLPIVRHAVHVWEKMQEKGAGDES